MSYCFDNHDCEPYSDQVNNTIIISNIINNTGL